MPALAVRRTSIAAADPFCAAIQWIKPVTLPADAGSQPDGQRADR